MVNRISRFYESPVIREDDYQAAYLSGYADSESRYSGNRIRAALCYVSLISGLVGFIVGALVARMS